MPSGRAVTIHSLVQARAALAAADALSCPLILLSAPDSAAAAGPAWFRSLVEQARSDHPEAAPTAVLDCGRLPGYALAALREGVRAIRYDGPARDRIADIAAQYGATVLEQRPDSLDLGEVEASGGDLQAACREWLGEGCSPPRAKATAGP